MITTTRVLLSLAFLGSLVSGCDVAVDGEEEASLVEAEGYTKGLVVRPLDPPRPGTQSASLELSAPDPDGYLEGRLQICKVVPYGGVECDVWYCQTHQVGADNQCEWTCGWSCQGSLDECEDPGQTC